jgi:hypothetical protein
MSLNLRITLIIAAALFLIVLLMFLRKKSVNLNYSLLWILFSFIIFILALFPKLVSLLSDLVGIATPSNTIFAVMISLILIILIFMTSVVSKQHRQIKTLAQELAIIKRQNTMNCDEKIK